jgi:hypothetical protein
MRNPEEYREHAKAAEDMASRTSDHLLKTNFLQLARTWRAAAEKPGPTPPKTVAS